MNITQVLKYTNLLEEFSLKEKRKTARENTACKTPAKKTLLETYREVARRKR